MYRDILGYNQIKTIKWRHILRTFTCFYNNSYTQGSLKFSAPSMVISPFDKIASNFTNFLTFYQISTLFHVKSLSKIASYNQFPCIKDANSPLIRLNGVNFHELFTFFCITGVPSCELFLYAVKIHVLFCVFSRTRIGTKFFSPLFFTNFF